MNITPYVSSPETIDKAVRVLTDMPFEELFGIELDKLKYSQKSHSGGSKTAGKQAGTRAGLQKDILYFLEQKSFDDFGMLCICLDDIVLQLAKHLDPVLTDKLDWVLNILSLMHFGFKTDTFKTRKAGCV